MLNLKIKTKKGTTSVEVPESWKECTLGMWLRLSSWDGVDYVKGFSKIVGIDYDIISRSKSKRLYRILFEVIGWTSEEIDWEHLPVPEYLTIEGKDIQIPKNIGEQALGQKILVHEAMVNTKNIGEVLPVALAVYLDPLYHGKEFDRERAIKFEEKIKQLPVLEAYPTGIFFLTRLLKSPSFGIKGLLQLLARSLKREIKLPRWQVVIDLRS